MTSADDNNRESPAEDAQATPVDGSETVESRIVANSSGSLIGSRLGDYQVMRKLGRGGMADVYAARHLSLGRDVALKVLRSDLAHDKDYIKRFQREARAAANLNHPNIVQVFDVGNVGSLHYIAQELIDGQNLKEILDRDGVINASDAIEVLVGVGSALEAASESGITHRDIKPENIMRSSRGIIKVADFGLARVGADSGASQANLTQAGLTLGTPRYMSPEQVQGQAVDVRSDLYSLGVSMYHLLAGRPPFEADDPLALAVMHLQETPQPLDRVRQKTDAGGSPDLPEWLIAVVSRLLNKLPRDRFQSPNELLDAIRNEASTSSVGGLGIGTAAATIRAQRATDRRRRNRRRRQSLVAAAILLPLLCASVAGAVVWSTKPKKVSEQLRPQTVKQEDTVQEQYLVAMTRNDEAGWRAVGTYFPPADNATNAGYHAKASLQLAALFISEGQLREADRTLDQLLQDPSVDRLHQLMALVHRCAIAEKRGPAQAVANTKQEIQSLYEELKTSNPSVRRVIERVLSDEQRLQFGIEG